MRRKDGKPKRKARRTMPQYSHGFFQSPKTAKYRHACWSGTREPSHHRVVSLFSGCGGLDLGFAGGFRVFRRDFQALPFDVVFAVDNSEDAVRAYELNLGPHVQSGDLTDMDMSRLPECDVLLGGFPCQDFSSSGPKVGLTGSRGQLYRVLVDYMRRHRPKLVVGENVPHLARLRGGRYLDTILRDFRAEGYQFDVWDLYAPDFGLPQSRRRLFLVGVREDISGFPERPEPTHAAAHFPIDQALKDLEAMEDERVTNQSQFYVATRATAGGGQGDHTNRAGEVAYCIRANARGRIQFHYKLPRRLTVRECARLQSFPDEFVFPFSTQRNLTLIGNAVPPLLGHQVASSVAEFLDGLAAGGNPRSSAKRRGGARRATERAGTQLEMFRGSQRAAE